MSEKELEITVEEFKELVPNCCPHCVEEMFPDLVMLPLVYEDAKLEDIVKEFKKEYSTIRKVAEYMGTTVYYDKDGNEEDVDLGGLTEVRWECSSCQEEFEDYKPENY